MPIERRPRGPRLRRHDAARVQSRFQDFVKLAREQPIGGARFKRVGNVYDGDVESLVGIFQIGVCVRVDELDSGVFKRAAMMVGQMLAAERDDSAVNVRHERPLDGIVPQRLAYGGAFAAARHEHGARRGMGCHRGVD